jgi:hypothetical protein
MCDTDIKTSIIYCAGHRNVKIVRGTTGDAENPEDSISVLFKHMQTLLDRVIVIRKICTVRDE